MPGSIPGSPTIHPPTQSQIFLHPVLCRGIRTLRDASSRVRQDLVSERGVQAPFPRKVSAGGFRVISFDALRCGSGQLEPEDPALIGPGEREFRQITQCLGREGGRLTAFEYRFRDVRSEPGQRQDAADGAGTQLLALG